MIKNLLENIILITLFNIILLFLCKNFDNSFFDYKKFLYREYNWENNGKFYVKYLYIKKWKDCLPQYISKNGFSKQNLKSVSDKYIERFILETCRAEWFHGVSCLYFIISYFMNHGWVKLVFCFIPILINVPFICIQRYNRIRLKRLLRR